MEVGAPGDGPDGSSTLVALFDASAQAAPDAVALVAGDCNLTYGELVRRADRFADQLRAAAGPTGSSPSWRGPGLRR